MTLKGTDHQKTTVIHLHVVPNTDPEDVNLQNTNKDIFNKMQTISATPLKINGTKILMTKIVDQCI